ncbi:MAG: TOBE domain-containing protein, partial [Clostridia bacterium]|nr:TOBE domain-containing protein [Clostridia bacterium]
LLDEPLSNLDAKLRASMRTELTKLHQKLQTTFIYVTHDQTEAMTMASRIVVMKDGIIQQVDTPQNLYDSPVNLFVAGFIGTPQMNFINGKLEKKRGEEGLFFTFGENSFKLPEEKAETEGLDAYVGKEVIAGIRSEAIHDEPMYLSQFADWVIDATVDVTELMGAEIFLYLNSQEQNFIARVSPRSKAKVGDQIKVAFDINRLHLFDKDTEICICH